MWPSFPALLQAELGRYFLLCVLQAGRHGANVAGPSWGVSAQDWAPGRLAG